MGPTASGKTDLSIELAKSIYGECINSDSTQIFNGLDIATNKVTAEEQQGIKHHLFSYVDLNDSYSINEYQIKARETLKHIWSKNKIPIIVGGSALYISALLKDYKFIDENISWEDINAKYTNYDNIQLWEKLKEIDPDEALRTHYKNRKRVIRALHYFDVHKIKKSSINEGVNWFYKPDIIIGLNPNKKELHEKIEQRVYRLIEQGLFEEVIKAYEYCNYDRNKQSMKIIGCPEIISYLENKITYEECINKMIQSNKHYAKKQMTWFRNKFDNVKWYDYSFKDYDNTVKKIKEDVTTILNINN